MGYINPAEVLTALITMALVYGLVRLEEVGTALFSRTEVTDLAMPASALGKELPQDVESTDE